MLRNRWIKRWDIRRYKQILRVQDDDVKEYFDLDGCGLEIEFGVKYEQRCRSYIETGLRKMRDLVGNRGKFVLDMTIGHDLNVEIVLNPLDKATLKELFSDIVQLIRFYENFVFDENCGIHANFRADAAQKRCLFAVLVHGGYDSARFSHSKYKADFMQIVRKPSGETMTFDEYLRFQQRIGSKYVSVNFLKDKLIEFRMLDLNWDDVEYVFDLYERAGAFILGV